MLLKQVVDQIAMECDLEDCTIAQYRRSEGRFSLWLNRPATKEDLTVENVNGFVIYMQKQGYAGTTIKNNRIGLTRIWNYLTEFYNVEPYCVRRLRRPKVTAKNVVAWSSEEIRILVKACDDILGRTRNGIPHREIMLAWINLGYDTGLRPIDLRKLTWDELDMDACRFSIVQNKTGNAHAGRFWPETRVHLANLFVKRKEEEPRVFPFKKSGIRRMELKLYREARRHGFTRKFRQGIGTLRKSHATGVYKVEGEYAAAESLGHVGGVRTVRKSYIDHRAVKQGRLPPAF